MVEAVLKQRTTSKAMMMTSSSSSTNFFKRIVTQMGMHVRRKGQMGERFDSKELYNLCVYLARAIDNAVSNNEVPTDTRELALLLKQVCKHNKEFPLDVQAAIMMLMISAKSACKMGWFLVIDSNELVTLTNEIGQSFSSIGSFKTQPRNVVPVVSEIMSRFYPRMRIVQILATLEVMPGYGAYVGDFSVAKDTLSSLQEKIQLFVAQLDNTETSSCIISPSLVNILLNGRGVERRTNVSMEKGPQLPTDVTLMLQCGTNLLQAIGDFGGNYIIVVAVMNVTTLMEISVLQDYAAPSFDPHNSDSEVIEGPSRITLNCPISMRRIAFPVKGHLCKHHQCFDYENFMAINSRTPSWRCPHCKQSVCYTDLRVDRKISKILREVDENVADVIILEDGSWKPFTESSVCKNQLHVEVTSPSSATLTAQGMDGCDTVNTCETQDRKPFQDIPQGYKFARDPIMSQELNVSEFLQNSPPNDDSFWSRVLLSCSSEQHQEVLNTQLNPQPTSSLRQNQILASRYFENSVLEGNCERQPVPGGVSQAPLGLQVLEAQNPGHIRQQTSFNSLTTNGVPDGSQYLITDGLNMVTGNNEMIKQSCRPHVNSLTTSDAASSLQVQPVMQNPNHQTLQQIPAQSVQQHVGIPIRALIPGSYRVSQIQQGGAQDCVHEEVGSTRTVERSFNVVGGNNEMQHQSSRPRVNSLTSSAVQCQSERQNSNHERLLHFSPRSQVPVACAYRSFSGQRNSENQLPPQPRIAPYIPARLSQIQQRGAWNFVNEAVQSAADVHSQFYNAAYRANQMSRSLPDAQLHAAHGIRAPVGLAGQTGCAMQVGLLESMMPTRQMMSGLDNLERGRNSGALNSRNLSSAISQFLSQPSQSHDTRQHFDLRPQTFHLSPRQTFMHSSRGDSLGKPGTSGNPP